MFFQWLQCMLCTKLHTSYESQIMIITHYIILFVSTWKNIFMQFLPISFLTPVGFWLNDIISFFKRAMVRPSSDGAPSLNMNEVVLFSRKSDFDDVVLCNFFQCWFDPINNIHRARWWIPGTKWECVLFSNILRWNIGCHGMGMVSGGVRSPWFLGCFVRCNSYLPQETKNSSCGVSL